MQNLLALELPWAIDDGVFRLVLTGGPCAGKSTIISTLESYLESKGFAVLHVQETSTLLKNGGMHWSPDFADLFQEAVVSVQSVRENMAVTWASKLATQCQRKKTIILYDRGLVDGYCFVTEDCMAQACDASGIDRDLYKRYDCVFHLTTAADGAPKFYQNTSYRHENIEQAIEQDRKLQQVWAKHPNHFIFGNQGTFQQKIESVICKLCDCLGINPMRKTPRRYLMNLLPQFSEEFTYIKEIYHKTYIVAPNTEPGYLCSFLRRSERVEGSSKGQSDYVLKTVLNKDEQQITRKRRLTSAEYSNFLKFKDETRHEVKQTRTYISVEEVALLEIVYYNEPAAREGLTLLNVFSTVGSQFDLEKLPNFIRKCVQNEVTGEENYSAHYISSMV